jgi:hypothetical protein
MRALAPLLVLLTACGGPLSLDGNAFGPVPFNPAGAIAAEGTAGLTIMALEAPLTCDSIPPQQPGQRSLVLQVFQSEGPGGYAIPDEGTAFVLLDACALGGEPARANDGVITLEEVGEQVVGSFELTLDGEPGAGSFEVELCPGGFPVPERQCPDESDLPPPVEIPEDGIPVES